MDKGNEYQSSHKDLIWRVTTGKFRIKYRSVLSKALFYHLEILLLLTGTDEWTVVRYCSFKVLIRSTRWTSHSY